MLWVLKEPPQCDGSFEHPKQMLKLIDKKIFTNLQSIFCLSGPMSMLLLHDVVSGSEIN